MKIGIIGYKRHAKKHIDLVSELNDSAKVIAYHPSKVVHNITNCFDDILSSDAVIISSPSYTHLDYLYKLAASGYKNKIYLEKPGFVNLEESNKLVQLQADKEMDITIGYHFPYQEKIKRIAEILKQNSTGIAISIDIKMSKGISYAPWFKKDWRSTDNLSVAHTGLCHILSIYLFLFSNTSVNDIASKVVYNPESGFFDTAVAQSKNNLPFFKAIYSWGAPYIETSIYIVTTNSLIILEGSQLVVRSPRDSYNDKGLFEAPPISYKEDWQDEGIKASLNDFINSVLDKRKFQRDKFLKSVDIGRACLLAEKIK